jgi:hypothetical protein
MATFTPNYHQTVVGVAATVDVVAFAKPVNQVRISNQGTGVVYARVFSALDATTASALATATPAVSAAPENQAILPSSTKVIHKAPAETFIAVSLICSGANTSTVEGTVFFTN